jgi:hypothetical protein
LARTEVVATVGRMKESFSVVQNVVIRRGMYPLTETMMDDNFSILQQELEFCVSCIRWWRPPNPSTVELRAGEHAK